jgi:hypothetical protein
MDSQWLFLNVDELLYRFHLYIAEPIISFVSFRWLWGDSEVANQLAASDLGVDTEPGFFEQWFVDPIQALVASVSSSRSDTDKTGDYFPAQESSTIGDTITDVLFGSAQSESILSIIFGSFVGWVLILALVGLLIRWYLKEEIHYMEKRQAMMYDMANTGHVRDVADNKRVRWQTIVEQVNSDDVNQWKIAVLDADSLLDEVLYEQGYGGEGVATKLRAAVNDNYETLRYAQEAHGIRNRIAHDAGYALSHREAKMAISSYERFFNELYHM